MTSNSPTSPIYPTLSNHPAADVPGFEHLAELALNLRSCWNHATDHVWRTLDAELWDCTHNPWAVLQASSRDEIVMAFRDPAFRKDVNELVKVASQAMVSAAWFQQTHPKSPLTCIAYFSMEFMLSESLPIYSGGLGNVAGDQLKAASDLGVPVVGIGLLYQQGYFRQAINQDGAQQALYPHNDPAQLPITPVRLEGGELRRLHIDMPGYSVWCRIWEAQVGRAKLYLLDSNDPANSPTDRAITSQLYGGGPELRLKQEILLGIGGWRLLVALGIKPEVCHLNEGHAAFAVLERACSFMKEGSKPFEVALAATRAGNLFTTHTAVAAGFDRFDPAMIEHYFGVYSRDTLGISMQDLLALGRQNPDDATEPFNMAYLAIRGSGAVNGVSSLHGQVSRRLFAPLFPRWPEDEVPIGHITNGVHMPTWDSEHADDVWTTACGKGRWMGTQKTLEQDIRRVPDATLWQLRTAARKALVDYARSRLSRQLAASGSSSSEIEAAKHLFNPDALTLGFARRFATYKRPDLLLHDRDRLLRILKSPDRPVQLVIAGKAHPEDRAGQDLIREWITFIRREDVRPHIIFLSDYDMLMAEHLVQGVDVWLNTPRRPWEASGTSGMKVLVNGGLNLSELDGWWAEAYSPAVGWALGDGQEHCDDPAVDAREADQLYGLLEREVVPEFYTRGKDGLPTAWIKRIRESMATLTPRFSAERAVREYTETYYIPAATALRARAAQGATHLTDWRHALDTRWSSIRFGPVAVSTSDHTRTFTAQVDLAGLSPGAVLVELFANAATPGVTPTRIAMQRRPTVAASANGSRPALDTPGPTTYTGTTPTTRPASDYTMRLTPHHAGVMTPLEDRRILWQR